MEKEELIYITLKQLSENFKTSPENFRLEDPDIAPVSGSFPGPTIVWQFKFKVKENEYIQDPLNATRTIVVTFNRFSKQISCSIYFRELNTANTNITPETQATFQCCEISSFNRTYRLFRRIRKQLIKQRHEKEFFDYMKKLNNIFPATHEDEIFK